jgi:hypothetical protein
MRHHDQLLKEHLLITGQSFSNCNTDQQGKSTTRLISRSLKHASFLKKIKELEASPRHLHLAQLHSHPRFLAREVVVASDGCDSNKQSLCVVNEQPARWEPQEEGMKSAAASFPSVKKPRFIDQEKGDGDD